MSEATLTKRERKNEEFRVRREQERQARRAADAERRSIFLTADNACGVRACDITAEIHETGEIIAHGGRSRLDSRYLNRMAKGIPFGGPGEKNPIRNQEWLDKLRASVTARDGAGRS